MKSQVAYLTEDYSCEHSTVFIDNILTGHSGYAIGAERALLAAILFDGVQTYLNYMNSKTRSGRDKYKEALRWVHTVEFDYVFGFDAVCEGLGIDPNYMRCGLINAARSADGEGLRSRRTS